MTNKEINELMKEVGRLRHQTLFVYNQYQLSIINNIGKRIEYGYLVHPFQLRFLLNLKKRLVKIKEVKSNDRIIRN